MSLSFALNVFILAGQSFIQSNSYENHPLIMKIFSLSLILVSTLLTSTANAQNVESPAAKALSQDEGKFVFLYGRANYFNGLMKQRRCDLLNEQLYTSVTQRFENVRLKLAAKFGEKFFPPNVQTGSPTLDRACDLVTMNSFDTKVKEIEGLLDNGESKASAIEVCKPEGGQAYLSRLVCPTGESPTFKRAGNGGSRSERLESLPPSEAKIALEKMLKYEALKPGEVDYHVVDRYEVVCGESKRIVLIDMYHCDQPAPSQAIPGFTIRSPKPAEETRALDTAVAFNSELVKLLERLSKQATPEQYKQLESAIKESPDLLVQINKLASSGKLTDIIVVQQDVIAARKGVPFEAYIENTQAAVSANLLNRLLLNRFPGYVAKGDDIFPNHSLFVLGHLVFHLANADEMKSLNVELEQKIKELASSKGQQDYTKILAFYQKRKLESEAFAFIQSWNYMVDAAIQSNGKRALSESQFLALFVNFRYRNFFEKAVKLPENSLQFSKTGSIDATERNISAMVASLKASGLADFQ